MQPFLILISATSIATTTLSPSAVASRLASARAETSTARAASPVTSHFTGVLPPNRPAVRSIHLAAGDAVKLWALPGAPESGVSQGDLALGIGLQRTQFSKWIPYAAGDTQCVPSYYGNNVTPAFGQQPGFFSDYADPYKNDPAARQAIAAIGVILNYTAWYYPPSAPCVYSAGEAPYFFISARSDTSSDGLWAVYVAPSTANYAFALTGSGTYKMALSIQRFDKSVAPAGSSGGFDQGSANHHRIFPYTSGAWDKVVRSHKSWFLKSGFFPVHRFSLNGQSEDTLPALHKFFK